MEDRDILELLNRRDERAVTELLARYGGLCRSIISNILADPRDVEECVNGVMFRLWSAIPPAQPNSLKAYSAKAARNEALMRLRRNRSAGIQNGLPLDEAALFLPGVETQAEANELAESISRFLENESRDRRICFIKRYWFFMSVDEISLETGMTQSKVKTLLFRSRNALRKYLEKEGYLYE